MVPPRRGVDPLVSAVFLDCRVYGQLGRGLWMEVLVGLVEAAFEKGTCSTSGTGAVACVWCWVSEPVPEAVEAPSGLTLGELPRTPRCWTDPMVALPQLASRAASPPQPSPL